ncbi:MAG: hypothetical protein AB7E32_15205 [Desulfovibrio sp.]
MSDLYPYVDGDLFRVPQHYMYSKYHGQIFLSEYMGLRAGVSRGLEERLAGVSFNEFLDPDLVCALASFEGALPTSVALSIGGKCEKPLELECADVLAFRPEGEKSFATPPLLRALCLAQVADAGEPDDRWFWLQYFAKRFEVSKKIYPAYRPLAKPATEDFSALRLYGLASAAIAHAASSGNLKMLNAALKLNDLLCSKAEELTLPDEMLFTLAALRLEMRGVAVIAERQGVAL